jgi:hypothetical protein
LIGTDCTGSYKSNYHHDHINWKFYILKNKEIVFKFEFRSAVIPAYKDYNDCQWQIWHALYLYSHGNISKMTSAKCGAGPAYHCGTHEFILDF